MKAAIIQAAGDVPVYGAFAEPEAQAGEELVAVRASALSQLTRARASGAHYSASGGFPLVPGVDGVGLLADGRRVYFVLPRTPFGAMAERSVAAAAQTVPVPDGLDDVTAAAIANPGMSSWAALTERARFAAGETVLVNGATGTSGQLAVQIARHMGAGRIIATGRDRDVLAALGADETIPLTQAPDALGAAFAPAFAAGVDVVLDYLWGESARSLLIAAAKAGPDERAIRFVQIGSVTGGEIALPAAVLRSSAIAMMGSGIGSVSVPRLLAAIAGVFDAAAQGRLALSSTILPLEQVAQAWTAPGRARIVLTIG